MLEAEGGSYLSKLGAKRAHWTKTSVRAMREGRDTKVEPVLWVTCWLGWAWGQNKELGLTFQETEGLGSWLMPGLLQCQLGSTLLGLRGDGEMR